MIKMSENKRNITGLIAAFLMVVVGLALTPTIQNAVTDFTVGPGTYNLSGSALAIAGLIPMFWIILMIAVPVAYIGMWLKG